MNVFKKCSLVLQNAVKNQIKFCGFAVENVYHQNNSVNFHQIMLNSLTGRDNFLPAVIVTFICASIVKDRFQVYFSQILKRIKKFAIKKYGNRENYEKWERMISLCDSPNSYENILKETFSDGIVSYSRLYVVTLFTEGVCRRNPEHSIQIKNAYLNFIRSLE